VKNSAESTYNLFPPLSASVSASCIDRLDMDGIQCE